MEGSGTGKIATLIDQISRVLESNRPMLQQVEAAYRSKGSDPSSENNRVCDILNEVSRNNRVEIDINLEDFQKFASRQIQRLTKSYGLPAPAYIIEENLSPLLHLIEKKEVSISIEEGAFQDTISMLQRQGKLRGWKSIIFTHYLTAFDKFKEIRQFSLNRLFEASSVKVYINYKIATTLDSLIGKLSTTVADTKTRNKPSFSPNDPMEQYAKIRETKEIKAWLDGKFVQLLKDLASRTDVYKQKEGVYMFVGVALTVEYVAQQIGKLKGPTYSELNEEVQQALLQEKAVKRGLLQGMLQAAVQCNIGMIECSTDRDTDMAVIAVNGPLNQGNQSYQGYFYDESEEVDKKGFKRVKASEISALLSGYPELTGTESQMRSISPFSIGFCMLFLLSYPTSKSIANELPHLLRRNQ